MSIDRQRDRYFVLHNPYLYVQALQGTTPWTAIGMVTVLLDRKKQDPNPDLGIDMVHCILLNALYLPVPCRNVGHTAKMS